MERSRTYYEVVIESCDRKTNEFCGDREIQKTFDDRYYAQEFFDRFDIAEWYNLYVYEAEQKQYYTVLSLEEVTVTYDEDGDEDYREFFTLNSKQTSREYTQPKHLYLVDTNAAREFWTIEIVKGEIILRFISNNESSRAKNCDSVEDDSSWDINYLDEYQLNHLFDTVKIIDDKEWDD